jgi:two-component system sensor histidine kinase KdpD
VVSNALVWSPESAKVRVEARLVGAAVILRVIDRGPGIPLHDRERIFEPFHRLGDRSNDAGVGLGLAIAKGFVEAMGARLDVDDTPGGGTTMSIRLEPSDKDGEA